MSKIKWRIELLALLGLLPWLFLLAPMVSADEPAPSVPSPSPSEEPIEAISVVKIAESIASTTAKLTLVDELLAEHSDELEVEQSLNEMEGKLEEHLQENEMMRKDNAPTDEWLNRNVIINGYIRQIEGIEKTLAKRAELLSTHIDSVKHMQSVWTETKISVKANKLGPTAVASLNEVLHNIEKREKQLRQSQSELLKLQNRAFTLKDSLTGILQTQTDILKQNETEMWQRDTDWIWNSYLTANAAEVRQQLGKSLTTQYNDLVEFWTKNAYALAILLAIFFVIWLALDRVYRVIRPWAMNNSDLQKAVRIVEIPAPIASLITLIICFASDMVAPRLFYAIVGLVAIIPAILVLSRSFERYLLPVLVMVTIVFALDNFCSLIGSVPLLERTVLLLETLISSVFIWWYLRTSSFESVPEESRTKVRRKVKIFGYLALACCVVSLCANIIGFTSTANIFYDMVLTLTIMALLIMALVRFIMAMILFAVSVPPLALSNLVNVHRSRILTVSIAIMEWCAVFMLLYVGAHMLGIYTACKDGLKWFVDIQMAIGSLNVSVGQCLLAIVAMVSAVYLAKLLNEICTYDIIPRFKLQANAANLLNVSVRYVTIFIGFCMACAILGLGSDKLTVILGALSVGIGFGLQNIINNFVSGLILLFEPRICVGGTVEFGKYGGTLVHVGLRASVVRLFDGRELIVPNSELMSQTVVCIPSNPTKPVRFCITFTLINKVDSFLVKKAVEECVRSCKDVVSDPPPSLLMTDLDNGYPTFSMYAWARNYGCLIGVNSATMYAIKERLEAEGWQLAGNKLQMTPDSSSLIAEIPAQKQEALSNDEDASKAKDVSNAEAASKAEATPNVEDASNDKVASNAKLAPTT